MFEVNVFAYTHKGHRKARNEDTLQVFGFSSQSPDSGVVHFTGSTDREHTVVAIADGVSKPAHGDVASRLAVDALCRGKDQLFEDERGMFVSIDEHLREEAGRDESLQGMATTLVALLAAEDQLAVISVGDSECHFWRSESYLTRVTTSDSAPAAIGEQTSAITQALGGSVDRSEFPLDPHVYRTSINNGDVFLVCSDGLTSYVSARDIERRLLEFPDRPTVVEALVSDALDSGGRDNISVALVEFRRPFIPSDSDPQWSTGSEPRTADRGSLDARGSGARFVRRRRIGRRRRAEPRTDG